MTNQYAPNPMVGTDIVGGQGIMELIAQILQMAAQNQNQLYGTAGYYDPYSLGGGALSPTLQRELGMGQLGLSRDQLALQERLGLGAQDLDRLGLLTSRRGPENAIAYNYLLGNMGVPPGTPASSQPLIAGTSSPPGQPNPADVARAQQMAAAWNAGDFGQYQNLGGTATVPAAASQPLIAQPAATTQPQGGIPITGSFNEQQAAAGAGMSPEAQTVYDAAFGPGGSWGVPWDEPSEPEPLIATQENQAFNEQQAAANAGLNAEQQAVYDAAFGAGGSWGVPWMAQGGKMKSRKQVGYLLSRGSPLSGSQQKTLKGELHSGKVKVRARGGPVTDKAIVGDDPRGVVGTEEVVTLLPPKGGRSRAKVDPLSRRKDPREAAMRLMNMGGGMRGYADGGLFGGTVFSGEEIAGTPAVQSLLGNQGQNRAGQTGLNTMIPGSQTSLGDRFNLTRFIDLNPSEQAFIRGIYETPRDLGGLGLDFSDIAQRSVRSAPVGLTRLPQMYGA